jgi:hypothetical protein
MPETLAYNLATAPRSASRTATAAIAILDFFGDPQPLQTALSIPALPEPGQLRLVRIPGIDEALLCRITPRHTQLHTHAGPFVLRRLADRLAQCGIAHRDPASNSPDERFNHWLAHAPSPRAIDLLLANRSATDAPAADPRLNRLLIPPLVVAVGPPNAGKSSLLNALARRSVAVVSEHAGTTRDSVGAMLELDGLAVRWLDLPGIRETDDPIEAQSIRAARDWAARADLIVGCTPCDGPPAPTGISIDIAVRTKSDLDPPLRHSSADTIACSARTGQGLPELAAAIRQRLTPDEILIPGRRWELPQPSDSTTFP